MRMLLAIVVAVATLPQCGPPAPPSQENLERSRPRLEWDQADHARITRYEYQAARSDRIATLMHATCREQTCSAPVPAVEGAIRIRAVYGTLGRYGDWSQWIILP